MHTLFTKYKKDITQFLKEFLSYKKSHYANINPWGTDLLSRLEPFTTSGKMIRGGLFLFSANMFGEKNQQELLKIAAALELTQAGILIHDDIIDQDLLRRGQPSIYEQYNLVGQQHNVTNRLHFGTSLGICAGDSAFFMGLELLNDVHIDDARKRKLLNLFIKEIQIVWLSQMQDVYFGQSSINPSEKEILNLYRLKTGRYSFSLPLMLGAIYTGQTDAVLSQLETLGQDLGVMFQIRDDYLGLFGRSETGKSIGGDICENKKTLYQYYLFEQAGDPEKKLLHKIFGKSSVTSDELEWVRNLITALAIDQKIAIQLTQITHEAQQQIGKLSISAAHKELLIDLVKFNLSRTV